MIAKPNARLFISAKRCRNNGGTQAACPKPSRPVSASCRRIAARSPSANLQRKKKHHRLSITPSCGWATSENISGRPGISKPRYGRELQIAPRSRSRNRASSYRRRRQGSFEYASTERRSPEILRPTARRSWRPAPAYAESTPVSRWTVG